MSDCIDSECLLLVNHQSTGDVPVIMQALTDANKRHLSRHVCWIIDDMFRYTHFGLPCHIHGDFFILQVRFAHNNNFRGKGQYSKRSRVYTFIYDLFLSVCL